MSMVLGITGGIATGKSTVVNFLRQHGFPIVDGDVIAREVVEPNTLGLATIVDTFGVDILQENGTLNRKKLGALVFSDEQKREQLNAILGPIIRLEILRQIDNYKSRSSLVIADIPLLFESHYEDVMDQVAVVYVPEEIQEQRLMARDQLTKEEAQQRIKSQMPIEEKKQLADVVFDNQGSQLETQQQVEKWLKEHHFLK
ncbi:dephospho-CoA kinase [Candidatus Enterococcus willemsii]|nr:dephospho-CoA kinase [Enterococcus sp. CU12B]